MTINAGHVFLFLAVTVAVIRLSLVLVAWRRRRRLRESLESGRKGYDELLNRRNPYYCSLTQAGKDRFLRRVLHFIETKEFDYIDIQPQESMPILISATAVQVTFGLEHYLLDYFRTIHIVKDRYLYGAYDMPFEGHVSADGIYLSWSHFVKEFTDYSDGQNVGLHEMAHALTYVNFTVQEGRDKTFYDKFSEFSLVARPIFERMQAGESTLLDSYAATSYHEFWAVCVETFFERPASFLVQLPELYSALCTLLNQDPLTPDKLLTPKPDPQPDH